jgi:predicted alpha/beta-hydrolase family hydrolase
MDFPYRLAGRRRPDSHAVLLDAVRRGAGRLAGQLAVTSRQLLLGGRSMGGRICSEAVADGLTAAGLILVSYPLHPPGRPERLRNSHFPLLSLPCLFVSGTRDAFASPDELEAATQAIPGPVTHAWVEGSDHSMRRREAEAASAVGYWLAENWP